MPLTPLASPLLPTELRDQVKQFAYSGQTQLNAAPPCKAQAPLGPRTTGTPGRYPHVEAAP